MAASNRTQNAGRLSWAEALSRLAHKQPEAVPPEWRTIAQIAAETGKSRPHTFRLVLLLCKQSIAERRGFRPHLHARDAGASLPDKAGWCDTIVHLAVCNILSQSDFWRWERLGNISGAGGGFDEKPLLKPPLGYFENVSR